MESQTVEALICKSITKLLRANGPYLDAIYTKLTQRYRTEYCHTTTPNWDQFQLALGTPLHVRSPQDSEIIAAWEGRTGEKYILQRIDECRRGPAEAQRQIEILEGLNFQTEQVETEVYLGLFQSAIAFLLRARLLALWGLRRRQQEIDEVELLMNRVLNPRMQRGVVSTVDSVLGYTECLLYLYRRSLNKLQRREIELTAERESLWADVDMQPQYALSMSNNILDPRKPRDPRVVKLESTWAEMNGIGGRITSVRSSIKHIEQIRAAFLQRSLW